jgi:acetyltransferase-like isoleucine patch superfamily enzyme
MNRVIKVKVVLVDQLLRRWRQFWLQRSGFGFCGRIAYRIAAWGTPPYYGRIYLAELTRNGFIAPTATIHHRSFSKGDNVYIGSNVKIYQDHDGGMVKLEDKVKLIADMMIQTGAGGSCTIGSRTSIQPHCQISAYKSPIVIGSDIEIAPNCAFYSYDHGTAPGMPIAKQPLQSKGGIVVGDEAWLGVGVIVLDGVTIGRGTVVGAGSVVTKDLPDNSICAGVPARVIGMRDAV